MLLKSSQKHVAIALTLLLAGHLVATHAGHLSKAGDHDSADTDHPSIHTHAHYDIPQDLDSRVLPASNPCPVPAIVGHRIDPEFDFALGCQAIAPLVDTMTPAPVELPVSNDLPRPAGPDRQAILQRFTL